MLLSSCRRSVRLAKRAHHLRRARLRITMSVWGVRGPVQFALPGPNSKREDGYSPQPQLQRSECDVGLEILNLLSHFQNQHAFSSACFRGSTDPPRLTGWKSLHRKRSPASDVSCRAAGTAHGSKPGGSFWTPARSSAFEGRACSAFYGRTQDPDEPATPEVPLGNSVRSRQPSLRNAYRRASPNPRCPFELRVFRFPETASR